MLQDNNKQAGFKCPACGEFIPTSMEELVSCPQITCIHCGLVLMLDRNQSGKAIELMNNVLDAKRRVDEAGNMYK